jgi:hypothetical protein
MAARCTDGTSINLKLFKTQRRYFRFSPGIKHDNGAYIFEFLYFSHINTVIVVKRRSNNYSLGKVYHISDLLVLAAAVVVTASDPIVVDVIVVLGQMHDAASRSRCR